ncbi:MAG: Gfo/Idh/MocA family protein [Gemmatimonadota bacterium]
MIRIVHVGVGIRGSHWVEFVRDHPDTESAAFVDRDPAALERARRAASGEPPCFEDLARALEGVEADAALIASPSALHADHARAALEAGLAVMVEKPFAERVEDAAAVLRVADETGRPLLVAENYRYWPAERTVGKLVATRAIGRIDAATLVDRRNMPARTEGPWLAHMEYPQLQEIAIHHFDSLRYWLAQEPRAISARAWNPPRSDYRHGANTQAWLEFEETRVQYLGTLTSHRFSFSLWIEGEGGVIWTNRKQVFLRAAGSRFFRPVRRVKGAPGDEAPYPKGGTTSLLNALHDAVRNGVTPETNGTDNIWNVAMVEAARRSDQEGRVVAIDEIHRPSEARRTAAR